MCCAGGLRFRRAGPAGDAGQGRGRRGRVVDHLLRSGEHRAAVDRVAPRTGLYLRPRPDERGARSADDPEAALQPGPDRLGEGQRRRHHGARRGAGAADGRGRRLDPPARSQAPHADLQHPRDHAPALRGAGLCQLHADRGGRQGVGDSGRGGAFLQVDLEGQPAAPTSMSMRRSPSFPSR